MTPNARRIACISLAAVLVTAPASFTPAHAGPKNLIKSFMLNTGADPGARGAVQVVQNKAQTFFKIRLRHADPITTYDVLVNGMVVDQIATNADGAGMVTHRSRNKGKQAGQPLPYDPRGATVEIASAGTVILTADVPATPEECRLAIIEYDLTNTGVVPAATAHAQLKTKMGRMKFEVRVAGLLPGAYDLIVDGVNVASIDVDAGGFGEVEFDSIPQADDDDMDGIDLLLTFDPRGRSIEIQQTDASTVTTVYFTGTFPAVP